MNAGPLCRKEDFETTRDESRRRQAAVGGGELRWVLRVEVRMRHFSLLLMFLMAACSPAAQPAEANAPATAPATTRPAVALLSAPVADSRLMGKLYTVGDMSRLAPIGEVKIDRDSNAGWAEKNGAARTGPETLERLLLAANPVAPDDKLLDEWSYAPWCRASFVSRGRAWSVTLFLGGLGVIADDGGRTGAFRFDVPRGDGV